MRHDDTEEGEGEVVPTKDIARFDGMRKGLGLQREGKVRRQSIRTKCSERGAVRGGHEGVIRGCNSCS